MICNWIPCYYVYQAIFQLQAIIRPKSGAIPLTPGITSQKWPIPAKRTSASFCNCSPPPVLDWHVQILCIANNKQTLHEKNTESCIESLGLHKRWSPAPAQDWQSMNAKELYIFYDVKFFIHIGQYSSHHRVLNLWSNHNRNMLTFLMASHTHLHAASCQWDQWQPVVFKTWLPACTS